MKELGRLLREILFIVCEPLKPTSSNPRGPIFVPKKGSSLYGPRLDNPLEHPTKIIIPYYRIGFCFFWNRSLFNYYSLI